VNEQSLRTKVLDGIGVWKVGGGAKRWSSWKFPVACSLSFSASSVI